jgi:hypothetical protein
MLRREVGVEEKVVPRVVEALGGVAEESEAHGRIIPNGFREV